MIGFDMRGILMRIAVGCALVIMTSISGQTAALDDNDCGTNTGSTAFEACVAANGRPLREKQLAEKVQEIVMSLQSPDKKDLLKLFVDSQRKWAAYREATCKVENAMGPFNSIGWARCFDRLSEERMAYLNDYQVY